MCRWIVAWRCGASITTMEYVCGKICSIASVVVCSTYNIAQTKESVTSTVDSFVCTHHLVCVLPPADFFFQTNIHTVHTCAACQRHLFHTHTLPHMAYHVHRLCPDVRSFHHYYFSHPVRVVWECYNLKASLLMRNCCEDYK